MNVNRFKEELRATNAARLERLEKRRSLRTIDLREAAEKKFTKREAKKVEEEKKTKHVDDIKARFDAVTAMAMDQKREENALAVQIRDKAAERDRDPESETFTLTPEDCNADTRVMAVLSVPRGKRWYADRIAFFQSSATSNGPAFRHLKNTYLPTLGVANNEDHVPNMEKLDSDGDVIIKTGLFKRIFCGKTEVVMGQETIPEWIYVLLTDYCSIYYPHLLTRNFRRIIIDREDYDESLALLGPFEEIYKLFDLCKFYFSDVWQLAMSIGLSRFYECGVWVDDGDYDVVNGKQVYIKKFTQFASFIDEKFLYTINGYKDVPEHFTRINDRHFIMSRGAQSRFDFVALPIVTLTEPLLSLFTGRMHSLEIPLRSFKSINRFGGKSIKTRRQKRR